MTALQRNNVQRSGTGDQTVVLVHGFGTNQGSWRRVLPFFERRYQVVRYDLTGVGQSHKRAYEPDGRHRSLTGHAQDLLDICSELELRDALLIGHSGGGMIGMLAALREPWRFRKLALIASSPCYVNYPDYQGGFEREALEGVFLAVSRDYVAWCEHTIPAVTHLSASDALARDLIDDFKQLDPALADHFARVLLSVDLRDQLRSVVHPTLILQPTQDPFVPVEVARYLAEQIPNAVLKILVARGGHYPHLGSPDAVTEALREFFDTNS